MGQAFKQIQTGQQDVFLVGGVDINIHEFGLNWMERLGHNSKILDPETSCRPFDDTRQGTALSDGGAMLVVEELELAVKRGAHIYAEIKGFNQNCEIEHPYTPNGVGMYESIRDAMLDAGVTPS